MKPQLPRALKIDFWIDTLLLVTFLVGQSFGLTGIFLHEWIGVTMGAALLVHITLHWNWVVRTTGRIIHKRPGRDTIRWANNLVLILAMTFTVASGLWSSQVVLNTFGLPKGSDNFWVQVHHVFADLCLFAVALHVALSWRWILTTGRRIIGRITPVPRPTNAP